MFPGDILGTCSITVEHLKPAHLQVLPQALRRTRTDDPFLTMEACAWTKTPATAALLRCGERSCDMERDMFRPNRLAFTLPPRARVTVRHKGGTPRLARCFQNAASRKCDAFMTAPARPCIYPADI